MFRNAGNLTFNNITIKNNYSTKGLIYSTAKTTFIDTNIIHNASTTDGGLAIQQQGDKASGSIEGKTLIDDNFTVGNGGIIRTYSGAIFEMNSGTISNNKSSNSNGVVTMIWQTGAKFILNGGVITGNSGVCGKNNGRNGMVYIHSGGIFIMNGGTISENRGQVTGGIDAPGKTNSNVELNGGTIKNNRANEKYDHHTDAFLGDFNLTIGEKMYIEGDIYIVGDIVNNGTIKGDITLALGKDVEKTITGTGSIEGDVVLNYSGDIPPKIDESVKITGKIETTNTDKYTTVRFFYNGGIDQNKNKQQKIVIELKTEPTIPIITRDGHTFLGWYADKELTKKWESGPIEADTSVYAKWEINSYVLIWKIEEQETQETLVYGDKIILPEEPTKDGYNFIGWKNYQEGMTMPGNDLTIIAIFQKIEEPKPEDNIENPETNDTVEEPETENNIEVSKPNSDIENPKTSDNIIKDIIILTISVIALLTIMLYLRKHKRAK